MSKSTQDTPNLSQAAIDEVHNNCAKLPIVGSNSPCLLSPEHKVWFQSRELHQDEDKDVCFYEPRRGKLKKYLVKECVMSICMADGSKPMHPLGEKALVLYIKVKTPADIQKHCFDCLKKK